MGTLMDANAKVEARKIAVFGEAHGPQVEDNHADFENAAMFLGLNVDHSEVLEIVPIISLFFARMVIDHDFPIRYCFGSAWVDGLIHGLFVDRSDQSDRSDWSDRSECMDETAEVIAMCMVHQRPAIALALPGNVPMCAACTVAWGSDPS